MAHRIFITGSGTLCPTGAGDGAAFGALLEGRTGLRADIGGSLAVGRLPTEAEALLDALRRDHEFTRRLDRTALLAIAAARLAAGDAAPDGLAHCGVILGTSRGAQTSTEHYHARFLATQKSSPSMSPVTTGVTLASSVGHAFGCRGPVFTVSAACQSGLTAMGTAFGLLQAGQAEGFLSGGSEACVTPFTLGSLDQLGLVSRSRAAYPLRSGEPDRDGTVLAEGASVFIIESDAAMRRRAARPLAEIAAFAHAGEPGTLTGISPEGEALQHCLRAIMAAGEFPDAVIGHFPGTRNGDAAEMAAYRAVFGKRWDAIPTLAFKWSTGHMLAASPAFSVAMAPRIFQSGRLPTLPFRTAENQIPVAPGPREIRTILVTALGFGGNAAAMLLRRPE